MIDKWSRDVVTGYWFHFRQVCDDPERFVWEIWSPLKTRKIAQSADEETYTRLRTCGRGAQRHLQSLLAAQSP